jgi:hypothetical protein
VTAAGAEEDAEDADEGEDGRTDVLSVIIECHRSSLLSPSSARVE